MMRVFITGIQGLLGCNLACHFSQSAKVMGCDVVGKPFAAYNIQSRELDLFDFPRVQQTLTDFNPDVLIHCAALVNVDLCEEDKDLAYKLNVEVTGFLTKICEALKIKMIYISTDAVFDGLQANKTEDDTVNPINQYALTKLLGEQEVTKLDDYLILRTNIYGWNRLDKFSLAEWIYHSVKSGKATSLFDDITFSPILVNNLAEVIAELIESNVTGLFHVAGIDSPTKYEFGLALVDEFSLSPEHIIKSSAENFPFKAPRPKDMSLDVSKVSKILQKTKLLNFRAGIKQFAQLYRDGFAQKLKSEA